MKWWLAQWGSWRPWSTSFHQCQF